MNLKIATLQFTQSRDVIASQTLETQRQLLPSGVYSLSSQRKDEKINATIN